MNCSHTESTTTHNTDLLLSPRTPNTTQDMTGLHPVHRADRDKTRSLPGPPVQDWTMLVHQGPRTGPIQVNQACKYRTRLYRIHQVYRDRTGLYRVNQVYRDRRGGGEDGME